MGKVPGTHIHRCVPCDERSGFKEETYHTFSYSPIAADDGEIAGMLCVVSEETAAISVAANGRLWRDVTAVQVRALVSGRSLRQATEDAGLELHS